MMENSEQKTEIHETVLGEADKAKVDNSNPLGPNSTETEVPENGNVEVTTRTTAELTSSPRFVNFNGNGIYARIDICSNPGEIPGSSRDMMFPGRNNSFVPFGKFQTFYTIDSDSDAEAEGQSSDEADFFRDDSVSEPNTCSTVF